MHSVQQESSLSKTDTICLERQTWSITINGREVNTSLTPSFLPINGRTQVLLLQSWLEIRSQTTILLQETTITWTQVFSLPVIPSSMTETIQFNRQDKRKWLPSLVQTNNKCLWTSRQSLFLLLLLLRAKTSPLLLQSRRSGPVHSVHLKTGREPLSVVCVIQLNQTPLVQDKTPCFWLIPWKRCLLKIVKKKQRLRVDSSLILLQLQSLVSSQQKPNLASLQTLRLKMWMPWFLLIIEGRTATLLWSKRHQHYYSSQKKSIKNILSNHLGFKRIVKSKQKQAVLWIFICALFCLQEKIAFHGFPGKWSSELSLVTHSHVHFLPQFSFPALESVIFLGKKPRDCHSFIDVSILLLFGSKEGYRVSLSYFSTKSNTKSLLFTSHAIALSRSHILVSSMGR